jgi:hypothetical protein
MTDLKASLSYCINSCCLSYSLMRPVHLCVCMTQYFKEDYDFVLFCYRILCITYTDFEEENNNKLSLFLFISASGTKT